MRRKLAASGDGDRRRVKILAAVVIDGLPGVEAACLQALSEGRLRPTSSSTSSRVSEIRGQRRQFRHPTPYGSATPPSPTAPATIDSGALEPWSESKFST
jgi:hypothetical protein